MIPLQDKPEDGYIEANLDVSHVYDPGILTWTPVHGPWRAIRTDLRHLDKRQPACWKLRDLLSSETIGVRGNDLPFANRSATRHPDPICLHPLDRRISFAPVIPSFRARHIQDDARSSAGQTAHRCFGDRGSAARAPIQQLDCGGKHVVSQQRLFCRRNGPPLAPIASAKGKLTS